MKFNSKIKSGGAALLLVLTLVGVQPTSAVVATLDGPNQVSQTGTGHFTASVGVETADARLDSLTLTFRPVDGDGSVTVTLAPDGTIRRMDPARGTVGRGEIRVGLLRRTLVVTPADGSDGGYGYDAANRTYDVRVDARAFKRGTYEVTLTAICEGGASASGGTRFEVTLPNAAGRSAAAVDAFAVEEVK